MSVSGALEGMLVLDAGHVMAGPFCAMLLGDMGAEVIKIEKPGGDDTRTFGPPFINGESVAYMAVNRNKRGICINLKTAEGRRVFCELIRKADALVENYAPGTMAKLGLGYEDLKRINPGLIYCSVTGFGHSGPYRERGGFDLVAQAMSGLISVTGQRNGELSKVGVPLSDLAAGMYGAQAIMAAYIHRLQSGTGQHLDVSLLDSAISLTVWESSSYFATNEVPRPMGTAHRLLAPYQAFQTCDKPIVIGVGNQRSWARLCELLAREDLLSDERFLTNELRTINQSQLEAELSVVFKTRNASEWLESLERAGIPAGPVYHMAEVYQDPHVRARQMRLTVDHPVAGTIDQIGSAIKFSHTPAAIRRPAPTMGQHTDEILADLGLSAQEIEHLRAEGSVG